MDERKGGKTMTRREIKAFFKRKDVKIAVGMFIVGFGFLAYIDKKWNVLCGLIMLLLLAWNIYIENKDLCKKRKKRKNRRRK